MITFPLPFFRIIFLMLVLNSQIFGHTTNKQTLSLSLRFWRPEQQCAGKRAMVVCDRFLPLPAPVEKEGEVQAELSQAHLTHVIPAGDKPFASCHRGGNIVFYKKVRNWNPRNGTWNWLACSREGVQCIVWCPSLVDQPGPMSPSSWSNQCNKPPGKHPGKKNKQNTIIQQRCSGFRGAEKMAPHEQNRQITSFHSLLLSFQAASCQVW